MGVNYCWDDTIRCMYDACTSHRSRPFKLFSRDFKVAKCKIRCNGVLMN